MDAKTVLDFAKKITGESLRIGAKYGGMLLKWAGKKLNISDKTIFTCPHCVQSYKKGEIIHEASRDKCPKCNRILPPEVLETKNLPFSIVGVVSSGKTNYITVMLNELQHFTGIDLSVNSIQDTRAIHEKNSKTLYEDHTVVEGTAAGSIETQIWVIKNLKRIRFNRVPTYTFTIFDGAGENYRNINPSSPECRNIKASKAILLTLDPLILEGVRKKLSDSVRLASMGEKQTTNSNSSDIVHDMARYIKQAFGISFDKVLEIPVAIVLTKIDVIIDDDSFRSCATVRANSRPTDTFGDVNMGEIAAVDREIRNWLLNIGEGAFIKALEANFKNFRFFGVSSFGCAPDSRGHIAAIKPHRVLDPVLWLFKKYDFVD